MPRLPSLNEVLQQFWQMYSDDDTVGRLPIGWALRQKRSCKIFTQNQRQYLLQKFNDGIKNRRKCDPRETATEMRRLRQFKLNEFLSWQQIAGFWSREAKKREATGTGSIEADDDDCLDDFFQPDPNLDDEADDIEDTLIHSDCFDN
jgi:hypothetical protein